MLNADEAKKASLRTETMADVKDRLSRFVEATLRRKKRGFNIIISIQNLEETEVYLDEKRYFFEVRTETASFAVLRVWW